MRQNIIRRLATGVAIAALLVTGMPSLSASANAATATESKVEVDIRSFAAAFLAARTADIEFDTKSAIEFYRKALEYDPENGLIRERLMVDLFLDGQFDEGAKIVRTLDKDPAPLPKSWEMTTRRGGYIPLQLRTKQQEALHLTPIFAL